MKYKILVVDDEKDIVDMISERLLSEGFDVITAADGEEALKKVTQDKPDIVLLDLMLPKMHGFEVLKEIRDKCKDRWIPVLIISAQVDLESVRKSYKMEADHYLTKPCSMESILQGVHTMISLIPLRII